MATASGTKWNVDCYIAGHDNDNLDRLIERFEWKSLLNGGFIARVAINDPYLQILDKIVGDGSSGGGGLLKTARQYDNPTLVRFKLKYDNGIEGVERVALVSDVHVSGDAGFNGRFEFIAVDPVTYYINSGDCSGKSYRGKIGGQKGVITQVLQDYVPNNIGGYNVKFKVDDTDDQANIYWMMRQDPKTFIASLLDWSSSFTKHRTNWVVSSGQAKEGKTISINITEGYSNSLEYPATIASDSGPFIVTYGGMDSDSRPPTILKWEILSSNLLSALSTKMTTAGISAVSGQYFDKIIDKDDENIVFVKDDNTENKINPKLDSTQSFKKPENRDHGWTFIKSVPEVFSAGDIGHPYSRYIDGRARQSYLSMLNLLLRCRITCRGQPRLYDSTELGKTKMTLQWMRPSPGSDSPEPRFMNGDWLIYGWHHKLTAVNGWTTDIYAARLDYDAKGLPGS